mmetsp:Transcript_28035/g.39489  ORF Transcript_28035/g.39489 Transcript_28035/m.39489 type:complete len:272 (+) Transcript_28035:180-995(+)
MMSLKSLVPLFALVVNVVVAQPGYFPVCYICPGDGTGNHGFSNGGNILNTGLSSYSCNQAQNYGNNRELGDASCLIFQMYANRPGNLGCGCNVRQEFPVENLNPECDICGDGRKGIFPGTDDMMVMTTILMEMPCKEIYEFSFEYFPKGSCPTFQADVKDICCVAPSENYIVPPTPQTPAPGPSPPPPPPVYQAPPPETFCSGDPCSNEKPCCSTSFMCMDGFCEVKGRPGGSGTAKVSVYDPTASLPWDRRDRNLLRGVKEALTAQSGGY